MKAAQLTRRTWLLGTVVVLATVLVFVGAKALGARAPAPTWLTAPARRVDITERVTATGMVEPVVTSPVGAQVSGIVWKLHADYNSHVTERQVLVELDPSLFQNAVRQAESQLAVATAAEDAAGATLMSATTIRDRTGNLLKESLASKADDDAARASYRQAFAGLSGARAATQQARVQLEKARLDLDHSIIRSPVTGTVISRSIDLGQAVASSFQAPTLFTIAEDLARMQVHGSVDEADIGKVHVNQSATFTVDAFRRQVFHAKVREIRNSPQTLQNVVTYDVVLDVDNADLALRPGMTASITIVTATKSGVVAVPNEALRFRPPTPSTLAHTSLLEAQPDTAVYLPAGDAFERTRVTVGITDGTFTEIDGLEPGRDVILDRTRSQGGNNAHAEGVLSRGL